MTPCHIAGIGLLGPGLTGWRQSLSMLRGDAPRADIATSVPMPRLLPPNERRRTGIVTRLALAVAEEAMTEAGLPLDGARGVFASANGDGQTVLNLLEALAVPGRPLSPTQFHNSVHNAVAGYWSIGAGSGEPVTCLSGSEASFGMALLKATAEVIVEGVPVLLCVYDVPLPYPLAGARPHEASFAVALVLMPEPSERSLGTLSVSYAAEEASFAEGAPRDAGLAALARANPAAMSLRLLEALATNRADRFALPMLDGQIMVAVTPCA